MAFLPGQGHFARAWLRDDGDGESTSKQKTTGHSGVVSGSGSGSSVLATLRKVHQLATLTTTTTTRSSSSSHSMSEEKLLLGALNTDEPCCFLTVVGDNPSISVVHHLSPYSTAFRATGPLEGRVVAFLGDCDCDNTNANKNAPVLVKAPASDTSKELFGMVEIAGFRGMASDGSNHNNLQDVVQQFYNENGDEAMLIPPSHMVHVQNNKSIAAPRINIKREDDDACLIVISPPPPQKVRPPCKLFKLMWIPTSWAPYFLQDADGLLPPFQALKIAQHLVQTSTELVGCAKDQALAEPILQWLATACISKSNDPSLAACGLGAVSGLCCAWLNLMEER
jgi:hypothetical protein